MDDVQNTANENHWVQKTDSTWWYIMQLNLHRQCLIYVLIVVHLNRRFCCECFYFFTISAHRTVFIRKKKIVVNLMKMHVFLFFLLLLSNSTRLCLVKRTLQRTKNNFPQNEMPQNTSVFFKSRMNTAENSVEFCGVTLLYLPLERWGKHAIIRWTFPEKSHRVARWCRCCCRFRLHRWWQQH